MLLSRALLGTVVMVSLWFALAGLAAADERRPFVVIAAYNGGTEITDLMAPYAVLSQAGAEVVVAAEDAAPVTTWPEMRFEGHTTFAALAQNERQADIVIVPAMHDPADAAVSAFLRSQADGGALMVSVCDGAMVLAAAGLLDGRRATAHFYSASNRESDYPGVTWVTDARYVSDGNVISSAGVSASLPVSLHLVERFFGTDTAAAIAHRYGVEDWSGAHDTSAFSIGTGEVWTAARNMLFGWPRGDYALAVTEGVDEAVLGFALDMLSRTYRSEAFIRAPAARVTTRHGLTLLPAPSDEAGDALAVVLPAPERPRWIADDAATLDLSDPATAWDRTLTHLAETYGEDTAAFVATQLEYPISRAE